MRPAAVRARSGGSDGAISPLAVHQSDRLFDKLRIGLHSADGRLREVAYDRLLAFQSANLNLAD